MAILNNPEDFISGENVTAAKLNNLVDGATFLGGAGEATDGSTLEVNDGEGGDGSLRVKDLGITTAKLADGAVSEQKIADSAVTSGKIADGAIIASKIAPSAASAIMPPGGLIPYAGILAPSGWLLCDGGTIGGVGSGAGIESADYETLFDLIKTLYGNAGTEVFADGDTVLLPDLRGRVVAGKDDMGGTAANHLTGLSGGVIGSTLGGTGGSQSHLLTAAQSGLPDHTHKIGSQTNSNMVSGSLNVTRTGSILDTTGVTGGAQPASSAHNNVQPTIILNYIIKY
jgi:microcystin-dependent protein